LPTANDKFADENEPRVVNGGGVKHSPPLNPATGTDSNTGNVGIKLYSVPYFREHTVYTYYIFIYQKVVCTVVD